MDFLAIKIAMWVVGGLVTISSAVVGYFLRQFALSVKENSTTTRELNNSVNELKGIVSVESEKIVQTKEETKDIKKVIHEHGEKISFNDRRLTVVETKLNNK